MNTSIPIGIYVFMTYIVTGYLFWIKYQREKHLFGLSIVFVKSKVYLLLLINFVLANYVMIGKSIVKIFFGEIRVSELLGIVDKLKSKIITFMLIFITMRPNVDLPKLMVIIHIYFILLLNMISFNRAAYLLTAEVTNPNSRNERIKIFNVHIVLFVINFLTYSIVSSPLESMGVNFLKFDYFTQLNEGVNISELVVYCIFTCEMIYIQIKLYVKFTKLSIEMTELKLQKEWDHKKLVLYILNFFRYLIKVLVEIKLCILTVKSGVFPVFLFVDCFYSAYFLTKQFYKIYDYMSKKNLVSKLENYEWNEGEQKHQCICLEDVIIGKKLPCGHVLHEQCIK